MKIVIESPEDVAAINWLNVKERIMEDVALRITQAFRETSRQLLELKPGEQRTIDITLGSITISKSPDET